MSLTLKLDDLADQNLKLKIYAICDLANRINICDQLIKCCTTRVEFDDSGFYGNKKKLKEFKARKAEFENQLNELIK